MEKTTKKKKTIGILYLIIAVALIILGVIMLPTVTELGNVIIYYILGSLILLYIILYLFKEIKKGSKVWKTLVLVELVLEILLAVSLFFSNFISFITIKECFKIIGAVLYLHGFFHALRGYTKINSEKNRYTMGQLVIDLFIITGASFLFIVSPISNYQFIITTSIILFVLALYFIINGILFLTGKDKKFLKK